MRWPSVPTVWEGRKRRVEKVEAPHPWNVDDETVVVTRESRQRGTRQEKPMPWIMIGMIVPVVDPLSCFPRMIVTYPLVQIRPIFNKWMSTRYRLLVDPRPHKARSWRMSVELGMVRQASHIKLSINLQSYSGVHCKPPY